MHTTENGSIILPDTYRARMSWQAPEGAVLVADCLSSVIPGWRIRRSAIMSAMRGRDPAARDALYLAVYRRWIDDPLEVVLANLTAVRLVLRHLEDARAFELSKLEGGAVAALVSGDKVLRGLWTGRLRAKTGRDGTVWWFSKRFGDIGPAALAPAAIATFAERCP